MSGQYGRKGDIKYLELFDSNHPELQPDVYCLLYLCKRSSMHACRSRGWEVYDA